LNWNKYHRKIGHILH